MVILAWWSYLMNYSSYNLEMVLNELVDHENIGLEPMFDVLSRTVEFS